MKKFNDIYFRSHDGLNLYARDYSCLDPGPGHPTLVCIPGLTRNSADFHALCLKLQSHCRAVAVDLRGRGRSEYDRRAENYVPPTYVKDVQNLIETLKLQRVVFVGTSLGGLISLLIASGQPDYLRALVINDFGPDLEQAGLDRIKSYVGQSAPVRSWEQAIAQSREINGRELPDLSEAEWLEFAKNVYREGPGGCPELAYDPAIAEPFKYMESEATSGENPLWAAYDALPLVPLLLIRGALSDLLSASCVAEMRRRHGDFRYAEVPNRGHAPLLNEPAALEAIETLLRDLQY